MDSSRTQILAKSTLAELSDTHKSGVKLLKDGMAYEVQTHNWTGNVVLVKLEVYEINKG